MPNRTSPTLSGRHPARPPRDYIEWLDGGEQGQPPAEVAGGAGDFVAGRTVWMDVSLPPGHYFIICQVPDAGDGSRTTSTGMIREFEVH